MPRHAQRLHRLISALILACAFSPAALALAQKSPDATYEKALQLNQNDEVVAAVIEVKNALQADPKHLPSLVLASQIYLEQSLGLAAEESIRTALEAGGDRNLLLPMLGEALLQQSKATRLLGELRGDGLTPEGQTRVHTLRAQAHMQIGAQNAAREELNAAAAILPELLELRLVQIAWQLHNGDEDAGFEALNELLKHNPGSGEAWSLYGAVYHARGDFKRALEGYGKSLEVTPRNLDVRIARIGILIDLDRDTDTKADFDRIAKDFPDEPRSAYLASVIATRAGDMDSARKSLQSAIDGITPLDPKFLSENPTLLLVQGLAFYSLQNYESAIAALKIYVQRRPQDMGARKALGDALLQTGAIAEAILALEPVATLAPRDTRGQLLLANAYAIAGESQKATALLEKLTGAGGGESDARSKLAMLNIGAGRIEQGLAELGASVAEDPSNAQGALALVIASLKNGRSAEGVAAAHRLLATAPDSAVYLNLLGVALFIDGKLDEAREAFTRTLAREAAFRPAAINLGKLEVRTGQIEAARARFEALLRAAPDDPKLLLELSRVALAGGDQRKGLQLAERAAQSKQAGSDALSHLFDLQLAAGDNERALDLALRSVAVDEGNFEAHQRVATVQMRMNRPGDARATLKRMSQIAGFDVMAQLRTAAQQAGIGQFTDAEYSLFKALQQNPKDRTVHLAQVELSLRKGAFAEAVERASALLADAPDFAPAMVLRGHALLALARRDEALADFDRSNKLQPTSEATIGGYQALRGAGHGAQARERLETWLGVYPTDQAARLALAEDFAGAGDYRRARELYRDLLQGAGRRAEFLNNYAYLSLLAGDAAEAEKAAREAYGQAPQDPLVNDTLGWILAQSGRHEEGLKYLREAVNRRSRDAEIRYHLGFVLDKLGRRKEALAELDQALSVGASFSDKAKAEALRATLADGGR